MDNGRTYVNSFSVVSMNERVCLIFNRLTMESASTYVNSFSVVMVNRQGVFKVR